MNTALLQHRRLVTAAIIAAVVLLGVAIGVAGSTPADAHHSTISCVDQASSSWLVVNSERDRSMTFTSPQGPSGQIAAGGSATVVYVGDRLQIDGVWSNGQRASNVGAGDCTPDPITTTTTTTVPESTTTITTSSVPESTTTTLPPPGECVVVEADRICTAPRTTLASPPTSTTSAVPPTTLAPYQGRTCLLYAPGSRTEYSDLWLAEGEWVVAGQADAEGTTYVSAQWCKRVPPLAVGGPEVGEELPATGPLLIGGLALAGAVSLLFGWSLCRAAARGDERPEGAG